MDTETILYIFVGILTTAVIGFGGLLWFKEHNLKGQTFLNNLEWRRAVKRFGKDAVDTKPIEKAIINAPSAFGLQPFKVVVVTDLETKQKLRVASYGQSQIEECQALYIFCAIKNIDVRVEQFFYETKSEVLRPMIKDFFDSCPDKIAWAKQQAFIALGFGLAAAAEKQIYSCPMEGFLPDKYVEILGLNPNMIPCVLLAVGSESKEDKPHPRFRFGEADLLIRL